MTEPRSFASLTPTLLARKGTAKPAMRPQLQAMPHYVDQLAHDAGDDLGWNDMGHEEGDQAEEQHESAEVVAINPANAVAAARIPHIVRQQAELPKRVVAPMRRSALDDGRRAAFTLRVDAERHLKLRLACTLRNRSAQQMVTEALDKLLADLPEVTALAEQVAGTR